MSLLDFQVDLQETNRQLARIADLLERLVPVSEPTETLTSTKPPARVTSTSPAATWQETRRQMELEGRQGELLAGAYGPRSVRRD